MIPFGFITAAVVVAFIVTHVLELMQDASDE